MAHQTLTKNLTMMIFLSQWDEKDAINFGPDSLFCLAMFLWHLLETAALSSHRLPIWHNDCSSSDIPTFSYHCDCYTLCMLRVTKIVRYKRDFIFTFSMHQYHYVISHIPLNQSTTKKRRKRKKTMMDNWHHYLPGHNIIVFEGAFNYPLQRL